MLIHLLSMVNNEGDKALLNEMYTRYHNGVLATGMGILHNKFDAEDSELATWEKVLLHFSTAKEYVSKSWSAFERWLSVVAKNTARDELRKRKRRPEPIEIWNIPSSTNTETESELHMAINLFSSMPVQLRDLVTKRLVFEYSFEEIGQSLGCSAGTAQKRFSRAMKTVRKRIGVRAE